MNLQSRIFLKSIILSFLLSNAVLNAQILNDTVSFNLLKKGVDNIYNFEFNNAREVYTKLNYAYPGQPIVYLFRGIITYWENYPLLSSSTSHLSYESDMHKCIELCNSNHNPEDEAEYLLADLCARGMLLLYYADNDLIMNVIPLATGTYQYVRRSFDFTSAYDDFFFFTGLYNYYREAYPDAYPVYKTLAFLFPTGDRKKGLEELKVAAKKSIVLKGEAASFLSEICLSFENDYQEASQYSRSLYELYPANIRFRAVYIKNLLLIKQYDEAEKLILSSYTGRSNPFYQAQLTIFNGILQEKKYSNTLLADQYYEKGIKDISFFGPYGNELAAYAYFGMSRISEFNGDKRNKKIYWKKANELAVFKKVDFND